jgi:energy-coupling factor transporter transmembrane protein EcfT
MRRAHLWFQTGLAAYIFAVERIMPVSAYFQSVLFLILTAVALFASAGTLAITGFWLYLAIFAAIILASLLELDPGLLRERMRPGGKRPPLALGLFTIVLFVHWIVAGLDRGRFHWSDSVPPWLQALGLIAVAGGYALCFWAMAVNRFFPRSCASRPSAAICGHGRALRLRAASGLPGHRHPRRRGLNG